MRRLTSIVAVNEDGVIGAGNALPWRLRTDMKFFREQTSGNVVLMGRKTFDSLGQRCLPNRYNVVVSHSFGLLPNNDECASATGIADALFRASIAPKKYREQFVIGGASMYEQFAPFTDRYLITLVQKRVPEGDTFFDQTFLGNPDQWEIVELLKQAASDIDEAPFSIFEVIARDPEVFRERRESAISGAKRAAMAGVKPRSFAPRARSVDDDPRPYSMF